MILAQWRLKMMIGEDIREWPEMQAKVFRFGTHRVSYSAAVYPR